MAEALSAPHTIEYTYTRSTGPAIGAFLGALAERRLVGSRLADGRVLVPPSDYDPVTAEDVSELVDVADTGAVTTFAWNDSPLAAQPLDRPFAWALIQLDGADTSLLAPVDAGSRDAIATGTRVKVRWPDEPSGTVRDLVFEVA